MSCCSQNGLPWGGHAWIVGYRCASFLALVKSLGHKCKHPLTVDLKGKLRSRVQDFPLSRVPSCKWQKDLLEDQA